MPEYVCCPRFTLVSLLSYESCVSFLSYVYCLSHIRLVSLVPATSWSSVAHTRETGNGTASTGPRTPEKKRRSRKRADVVTGDTAAPDVSGGATTTATATTTHGGGDGTAAGVAVSKKRRAELPKATSDVTVDDLSVVDGRTLVCGVSIRELHYETLRALAPRLNCYGLSSKPRKDILAAIENVHPTLHTVRQVYAGDAAEHRGGGLTDEEEGDELEDSGGGRGRTHADREPRQKPLTLNQKLRSINTFLHQELRDEFAALGNQRTRAELDSLRGTDVPKFWHDAARLYNSGAPELGELQKQHEYFDGMNMNPGEGRSLTPRLMQKAYKDAVGSIGRYTRSIDA
eukprot:GHVU01232708.1.p1 GENE.GHVU01232708.1~~GHVU01232708.1.p1  ORF type:complete len:344 (-),score=34.14 GHVU01232708.1:272-1303(-)